MSNVSRAAIQKMSWTWSTIAIGLISICISSPGVSAEASVKVAFTNMADADKSFKIAQSGQTPIASVELELSGPSNVLVQFSAEAEAGEKNDGCPCSVRAFLQVDDQKPLPVKRINLGSPAVTEIAKYEHDRQEITGSLMFPVTAGKHKFTFIAQQVTGSSSQLKIDYPNLQAIAFSQ